jgi:hypothetical protein
MGGTVRQHAEQDIAKGRAEPSTWPPGEGGRRCEDTGAILGITTVLSMKATESARFSAVSCFLPYVDSADGESAVDSA